MEEKVASVFFGREIISTCEHVRGWYLKLEEGNFEENDFALVKPWGPCTVKMQLPLKDHGMRWHP